jgi:hypothetical protein
MKRGKTREDDQRKKCKKRQGRQKDSFNLLQKYVCAKSCQNVCVGVGCDYTKIEGPVRQENVREVFRKVRGARCVYDKKLESA